MYIPIEKTFELFNTYFQQDGFMYEFGVCTGNSIKVILEESHRYNKLFQKVYGFDSFEGLPKEKDDVWCNPDWQPGVFNVVKEFGLNTQEEAMEKLFEKWKPYHHHVHLLKGWFKDVLNDGLYTKIENNKATFLHIDTDLYISAYEALDWMFGKNMVEVGCVVRYDDWYSTPLWTAGESRAHIEIQQKYNLNFLPYGNVFIYLGKN